MKKSNLAMVLFLGTQLINCGGGQSQLGYNQNAAGTPPGTMPSGIAQTFVVTSQNAPNNFTVNGVDGQTLTLQRGKSYLFQLSVPGHPFYIMTTDSPNPVNAYAKGVSGNGSTTGSLRFDVPSDAPSTLSYNCSIHAAMSGSINVTN